MGLLAKRLLLESTLPSEPQEEWQDEGKLDWVVAQPVGAHGSEV